MILWKVSESKTKNEFLSQGIIFSNGLNGLGATGFTWTIEKFFYTENIKKNTIQNVNLTLNLSYDSTNTIISTNFVFSSHN